MAREVVWSITAENDLDEILKYWVDRNKSNRYSIYLNQLFKSSISILIRNPFIGRATDYEGVYGIVIRDYLLFYKPTEKTIEILKIWDTRQDPSHLKL